MVCRLACAVAYDGAEEAVVNAMPTAEGSGTQYDHFKIAAICPDWLFDLANGHAYGENAPDAEVASSRTGPRTN